MGAVEQEKPRSVGRYVLFREVAHGGMATVHIGRLRGPAGFARTVAIKRLHPPFARDPEFVSMFLDEARLAARIQHPNVVSVLDVVASEGELFLVMDYVHGESLSKLVKLASKQSIAIPPRIFVSIVVGVLSGLDAAHDARTERGDPLEIVHRDVSPQNVLLGTDGVARVLDFGVAKASLRVHWSSKDSALKGKLGYMAPEQITNGPVDRRADIYAAGVMLWEGLAGGRLYDPKQHGDVGGFLSRILNQDVEPPSKVVPGVPKALDVVVMKALSRARDDRYPTAHAMAEALERAVPPSSSRQVGEWVSQVAGSLLKTRAAEVAQIERAELPAASPGRTSDFRGLLAPSEDDSGSVPVAKPTQPARESEPVATGKSGQDFASFVPKAAPPVTAGPEKDSSPPSGDEEEVDLPDDSPQGAPRPAPKEASATSEAAAEDVTLEARTLQRHPADDDRTIRHDPADDEAPTLLREPGDDSSTGARPAMTKSAPPLAEGVPPPLLSWAGARRLWPVAMGLGALVLVLWLFHRVSRAPADTPSSASTTTNPAPALHAPLSNESIPLPPALADTTVEVRAEPPLAVAGAEPSSSPSVVAQQGSGTPSHRTWHAPPVKKKDDCDPPYTIDAQGVRIPKRHCM